MKKPFSVYSTWGLHDELGDQVELSETLARGALTTLQKWQAEHRIQQDFFHLDAFWFDPARGYRFFKPSHWPRGFEPLRDDILAAGMKPGLWFSTTGYTLDVPEWKESRGESGHYSLAFGPYAEILEAELVHAAEQWQVRLFKFDFADFSTVPVGVECSREEAYARAVERFIAILGRLHAKFEDVHVIAHVGYARNQLHHRTGWPFPAAIDPALLEGVDAVFSGDPQVMDVPQTHLTRNLDLYQDRAVWKMMTAGYPLSRIEDHGTVIGTTNTACYRGRAGFTRSHIGQLARGGRRDMFYGDPELLTCGDLQNLKAMRGLFFDAWERRLSTQFVGAGEPGVAPFHGYLTGGGGRGLLYLVNPTFQAQRIQLPLVNMRTARVLFCDGGRFPSLQAAPDSLTLDLGPEQLALIGLGAYAASQITLTNTEDLPAPQSIDLLPVEFYSTGSGLRAMLASEFPLDARLLVVVQVRDAKPDVPTSLLPFVFGAQTTKKDDLRQQSPHELITIKVKRGQEHIQACRRVPEVPVWSGVSWLAAIYEIKDASTGLEIHIEQHLDPVRRLVATAYALTDGFDGPH